MTEGAANSGSQPPDTPEVAEVLLVEDNRADARLVEFGLQDARTLKTHLTVRDTLSGAIEHLRAHPVDVVVLDLSLPDAHGVAAVAGVKSVAADTPIVILTGDSSPGRGEQVVALGAQDHLFKGDMTGDTLERTLRYALLRAANDRLLRQQQQLSARRDQVDAIERLSGAIAHELNNALTVVRSAAELLALPNISVTERSEFEGSINEGIERASAIADQLFALGGGRPVRTRRADLHKVVARLHPLLSEVVAPRADLRLGNCQPCAVEVSQGTLERAVKQLVFALLDEHELASGRGGSASPIRVELRCAPVHTGGLRLEIEAAPALPSTSTDHLADDLTLRAVARAARGRLEVHRTGEGTDERSATVLSVTFVGSASLDGASTAAVSSANLRRDTRSTPESIDRAGRGGVRPPITADTSSDAPILVVEDEPAVRRAIARLVSSLGHQVVTASDGREALAMVADLAGGVSALVSDVRMPGMSGIELVGAMVERIGPLPVVFVSGYNEAVEDAQGLEVPWALVPKPFSRDELAGALAAVLKQFATGGG